MGVLVIGGARGAHPGRLIVKGVRGQGSMRMTNAPNWWGGWVNFYPWMAAMMDLESVTWGRPIPLGNYEFLVTVPRGVPIEKCKQLTEGPDETIWEAECKIKFETQQKDVRLHIFSNNLKKTMWV